MNKGEGVEGMVEGKTECSSMWEESGNHLISILAIS
jgi:hypothetical protein